MRKKIFFCFSTFLLAELCLSLHTPAWGGIKGGRLLRTSRAAGERVPSHVSQVAAIFKIASEYSPAKRVLNARYLYQRELREASKLYERARNATPMTSDIVHLQTDIERTIVNNTLRASLLDHLQKGERSSILYELEDYYHLTSDYLPTFRAMMVSEESFARNALSYLKNHPHKPNWPLRHMLKTEGIDPTLVKQIKKLINQDIIAEGKTGQALQLLQKLHKDYHRLLKESMIDEEVAETVAIYESLADEVEEFTATNHRAPKFRADEEYERDLYNLIAVLAYHHQANLFEQVLPHIKRLYAVLERYPSPHYPRADVLRELGRFIEKNNILPRSIYERDIFNQYPNEDVLYESILYWRHQDPTFQQELEKLPAYRKIKGDMPSFNYY